MLTYEIVYRKLPDHYRTQIYKLWDGVLPDYVKDQRITQVFAVSKNDQDAIVGVSTVYLDKLYNETQYYYVRVFYHPEHRNRIISRSSTGNNFILLAKTTLASYEYKNVKPAGIVLELENKKISADLMTAFGLHHYGIKNDKSVWYYNFDGSVINV